MMRGAGFMSISEALDMGCLMMKMKWMIALAFWIF